MNQLENQSWARNVAGIDPQEFAINTIILEGNNMLGTLTVAKRLALAFGVLIILLALAILLGLSRLDAVNEMTDRIVTKDWKKTVLANDSIDLMNSNARESFLLFHVADRKPVRQRMAANVQAITQKLEALDALLYKPAGKALLADIREKRKVYVAAFTNAATLLDAGKDAEASKLMGSEVVPALDVLLAAVNKLIALHGEILDASGKEAASIYSTARMQLMVGLLLAILVGIGLTVWIVRSVTLPLGGEPDDARRVVERIALGDLTADIAVKPGGDERSLLAAMHKMQINLRKMVG